MSPALVFIAIAFISPVLHAFNDDPYEPFDLDKKMYDSTMIELHTIDVTNDAMWKECDQESRKRGFGGFSYRVYACSFWNEGSKRKCAIYLPRKTNMHQLGHEVRHCFQGSWHP